jgi:CheY-like chemotaxis protein
MTISPKHHMLLVEDEPSIRETIRILLQSMGYEVSTAVDGFDALSHLKTMRPEVLISDLNMPNMSGFELLSIVRRRFPEIWVVAISSAYGYGEDVPGGLIADAFYPKGRQKLGELLRTVADLIEHSVERIDVHRRATAPVWIATYGYDSRGVPFGVITCTECLRSFPVSVAHQNLHQIHETRCLFCKSPARYVIDFMRTATASTALDRAAVTGASPEATSGDVGGLRRSSPGVIHIDVPDERLRLLRVSH